MANGARERTSGGSPARVVRADVRFFRADVRVVRADVRFFRADARVVRIDARFFPTDARVVLARAHFVRDAVSPHASCRARGVRVDA
jgi:hypothetical protein